MPHLSGYCTCGREKHYPKNSRAGTTWACRNCGEIWMIVPRGSGKRLNKQSSRPPAQNRARKNPTPAARVPARNARIDWRGKRCRLVAHPTRLARKD